MRLAFFTIVALMATTAACRVNVAEGTTRGSVAGTPVAIKDAIFVVSPVGKKNVMRITFGSSAGLCKQWRSGVLDVGQSVHTMIVSTDRPTLLGRYPLDDNMRTVAESITERANGNFNMTAFDAIANDKFIAGTYQLPGRCFGDIPPTAPTSGMLTINEVDTALGGAAQGSFELHYLHGETFSGTFTAVLCESTLSRWHVYACPK